MNKETILRQERQEANRDIRPETLGSMEDCQLLRLPDIVKLIRVGKSTIWAWVKEGRFIPPIHLGPRTTVWRARDVRDWLADQGRG